MRQLMPNTGWRTIDNNVPEYIAVTRTIEVARQANEAAEAVRQIMNDLEVPTRDVAELISNGMAIISNDPTYTVLDGRINIGPTLTTSSTTVVEMSMEEIHISQEALQEATEEAIDDSQLEQPEPITKRKIVRRKKERPMFWKEEAAGERTTLPALIGETCSCLSREGSLVGTPSVSSPFVKMIPLKILNNSFNTNHRSWTAYSSGRRRHYDRHLETSSLDAAMTISEQNTGISQVVNAIIMNGRTSNLARDHFRAMLATDVNLFIKDINLVNVNHNDYSASSFDYSDRAFINGEAMRINARTFSASLGQLTCFLEESRWSRVYTPQIMGVILPENYVYQKQHVLVHGTIDLSKVVVLVNRELDDTDFHNKNFRAYYRKHLLPLLNSLKVDIWKVPMSFMEEQCFHGGVTLEKTSFMEKKQELEETYQEFRNQYHHIDLDPDTDDHDEDDEDYDDDDDDY